MLGDDVLQAEVKGELQDFEWKNTGSSLEQEEQSSDQPKGILWFYIFSIILYLWDNTALM